MVPQIQNGVSSTSCGNGIVSKTVLRMKIHTFCYFSKIEIYGKESVVDIHVKRGKRGGDDSETGSSNALTVIIFLVKAY